MGYTTEFEGHVTVEPPLNEDEINFLNKFSDTRRMNRGNGPYFVDGTGYAGQGHDPDITDFNRPPEGQPGLWCQWVPNEDGTQLKWNDGEKFYDSENWMSYLIDHFLRPGAHAVGQVEGLQGNHTVNGVIHAQGADRRDRWTLVVTNNEVTRFEGHRNGNDAKDTQVSKPWA